MRVPDLRVANFGAGPAILPLSVLERIQGELLNFKNTGMSVMELSHRSKVYREIQERAVTLFRELLGVPDSHEVLLLQGGASTQFFLIPMNFLGEMGETLCVADYIITGHWSQKAAAEAKRFGNIAIAFDGSDFNFTHIPKQNELSLSNDAVYVHMTSNNTIHGTQWHYTPETNKVPLVCDASSDILSRRINVTDYGIFYMSAQKNLGIAGLTVVVIRRALIDAASNKLPTMCQYRTHNKEGSLYNTPPTFAIYVFGLICEWIREFGGIEAIENHNKKKAALLYQCIDNLDFYTGIVEKSSRSLMNICFRTPSPDLDIQFVSEAEKQNIIGLKGHRSLGGLRASIYNAQTMENIQNLVNFMEDFASKYG